MKKICLFLGISAFLNACSVNNVVNTPVSSEPTLVLNTAYDSDAVRYRQNISVKDKGDTFVTYEYKDVRVDELASLAIKYCEEVAQGTNAHLREIVLYRNNARRATFDCVNLAM
ncbi:MAG: hypothetical protein IJF12_04475 [Alphaproteobacteria bacterium]|nr:hypothetical protein [Alphaproteobacteria bacterium]